MMTAFFWLLALFMLLLTLSVRPMGAWLAPLADPAGLAQALGHFGEEAW